MTLAGKTLFVSGGSCGIGYTIAKYGMTLCALGFAAEFADDGIAPASGWFQSSSGIDR